MNSIVQNIDIVAYFLVWCISTSYQVIFNNENVYKNYENESSAYLVISVEGFIWSTLTSLLLGMVCCFFKGHITLYCIYLPLAFGVGSVVAYFRHRESRYRDISMATIRSFIKLRYGWFLDNKLK